MANRVTNEQLEALVEFLAGHRALLKSVGSVRQWNALALKLNAFDSGSTKTGEQWKKYWADLQYNSMCRIVSRRQNALGTGSGPSTQDDLWELDQKILNIIGERAVFGDTEHRVPVFNIPPEVTGSAPVRPEQPVVSEVIISDTSDLYAPVVSPEPGPGAQIEIQAQQVPERHPTAVEAPAYQIARRLQNRTRRQNRPRVVNRSQARVSRVERLELERSRVQAQNKMADATLIIAEAAKKMAEASLLNAETARKQAEALSTLVEVVRKLKPT